jgi:hypothetical protein
MHIFSMALSVLKATIALENVFSGLAEILWHAMCLFNYLRTRRLHPFKRDEENLNFRLLNEFGSLRIIILLPEQVVDCNCCI